MNSINIGRKRPVGRPRTFDRTMVLDVALDLFWRHGFEGTSTAQLSEAMGISPPSLYAAFESKEALYREVVQHYLARFGGFMREPLAANGSARATIAQILENAAKQFTQAGHSPGCMVSCAALQVSANTSELAQEMAGLRKLAQLAVQAKLDEGRQAGELPPDTDTETLAAFFATIVQGMTVQARDGAKYAQLLRVAMLAMQAWPTGSKGDDCITRSLAPESLP